MSLNLISCLMVTRGRPIRAQRAIDMYLRQTWINKEMVVLIDRRSPGEEDLRGYVDSLDRTDIRVIAPPEVDTYVRLRNLAIREAGGEVICMWDDDDLYHPRRLEAQHEKMRLDGAQACYFGTYFHLDETSGKLRWGSFPWGGGLPGTLMCVRSVLPVYPIEAGGESGRDSTMQVDLNSRVKTTTIMDGYLYVYVFHGENVWDKLHHLKLEAHTVSPVYARDNFDVARVHLAEMGLLVDSFRDVLA